MITEQKIAKTFRLSKYVVDQIELLSEKTGKSRQDIVEDAILKYLEDRNKNIEYDKLADQILDKWEMRYAAFLTGLRMSTRNADRNSQIMLEVMNSILLLDGYKEDAFTPSGRMESPIIKQAREYIKEKIALAKQRKDDSKY